jgi:hypothetical protein
MGEVPHPVGIGIGDLPFSQQKADGARILPRVDKRPQALVEAF